MDLMRKMIRFVAALLFAFCAVGFGQNGGNDASFNVYDTSLKHKQWEFGGIIMDMLNLPNGKSSLLVLLTKV